MYMATDAISDMLRHMESPSKGQRKVVQKVSCDVEGVWTVGLMSVVLARQNSAKDHMRRPCTKKDAPAKQRGIWRKHLQAQEFRRNHVRCFW